MPACDDCDFIGEEDEFPDLTEDDIREHFRNGGFLDAPEFALSRAGTPVCPECGSSSIQM